MPEPLTRTVRAIKKADLNRLMLYHDRQFVELAYKLFLGREADEDGLHHHLGAIREGVSRREIAYAIGNSSEAKDLGVDPDLFKTYRLWRRIERVPVLGTFILIMVCLFRFKRLVREFRRLQNAAFGGFASASFPVSS